MTNEKFYAYRLASMAEAVPQLLEDCHSDTWQDKVAVAEAVAEAVADYARGLSEQIERERSGALWEEYQQQLKNEAAAA